MELAEKEEANNRKRPESIGKTWDLKEMGRIKLRMDVEMAKPRETLARREGGETGREARRMVKKNFDLWVR